MQPRAEYGKRIVILLVTIVAAVAVLLLLRSNRSRSEQAAAPPTAAAPVDDAVSRAWTLTVNQVDWTGDVKQHTCPKGGVLTAGGATGTGPYTTDSYACVAAVHAGVITAAEGGTITMVYRGPQWAFGTSEQHGVRTRAYVYYPDSFVFRDATGALLPAPDPRGIPLTWDITTITPEAPGNRLTFFCPPNGTPGRLLGTDVYSRYSSPCTAAVHAGLMTLEQGGSVTIESRPSHEFKGSERNGVTSNDDYPGLSFVVLPTARTGADR